MPSLIVQSKKPNMFVQAIEKVSQFTRPIHIITRQYGSDEIVPNAATLFFINELGDAITCRHVAQIIAQAQKINQQYGEFRKSIASVSKKKRKKLKEIEQKYNYKQGITIQIKNRFMGCVEKLVKIDIVIHPTEDLAILQFRGFNRALYSGHAIFLKDTTSIKQGKMLCRLGYPFPEFTNFIYDETKDDIVWTNEGRSGTPQFPIDGMITRMILKDGSVSGIEISQPGLGGQSGGPLFDSQGIIHGMQSSTHHLHLGFDIKDAEVRIDGKKRKVSDHAFLHLGNCVHADIIKSFLREKNVKFYEEEVAAEGHKLSKKSSK